MNEDQTAASTDATADAPASASAPTPPPAPPRPPSRFYSRMGRGQRPASTPTASAASAEPVSLDRLTAEEASSLRDNLPVRATAAPGSEATEFERSRNERAPREGGSDRGERRGRGRDRERGRGRDRERGRDRGIERDGGFDSRGQRERYPSAPGSGGATTEPSASFPASETEPSTFVESTPAATSAEVAPEAPRKLRFEDAPAHETHRTVQEFRPSHDRDFHRDAERARAEREKRDSAAAEKSSGLFGWMKSIFTPKPGEGDAPVSESAPPPRPRGGRGQGQGGGGGQPGHGKSHGPGSVQGSGEGGGRRRRRRRGGRNRNRNRDGGGGDNAGVSGGGGY